MVGVTGAYGGPPGETGIVGVTGLQGFTGAQGATGASGGGVLARGGTLYNQGGIATGANLIAWRAPYACTVSSVWGYFVGGTGAATINARKNGSSNHLASSLEMYTRDQWNSGGAVQNTSYTVGDKLEIMVVGVTGLPTQVAVQVDFTKP